MCMVDLWKPEPYIDIEKLQGDVYKVRLANNCEKHILHREEILDTK